MKKLSFLFLLALLPLMASADVVVIDDINYNLNTTDNTAEVAENKFWTNIIIPSTVMYEGLNYSVTSIGASAFSSSGILTSVTIPNSVTSIGESAFAACTELKSVTIGSGVTTIGKKAFSSCFSLTSVTIPHSVTSIGEGAFSFCSRLTSIEIPNSVTSIGETPFGFCSSLTSISVESGNTKYDSRNNCNAIIETATNNLIQGCINTVIPNDVTSIGKLFLADCNDLTSVTIPNSVKSIGEAAISSCPNLVSVKIGKGVTSIGDFAFYGCPSLTSVTCEATEVPSTGSYVLDNIPLSDATLYVPASALESYKATAPWSAFGTIAAIDDEPVATGITINETNFPDEKFRNWILSQEYGQDGVLTDEEIADVMSIKVSYSDIQSLKGLEYFTELEYLFCQGNQLKSLDLSKNTKLTYLNCGSNQLTSLDLSGCTAMTELWCFENQLTSLDVSGCTALTFMNCYANQLISLDVSCCTALESMNCSSNKMTTLNISGCTELQLLNCSENQLTSLDASNNPVLESLQCSNNNLTSLDVTNTAMVYIECFQNQINGAAMDAFVKGLPQITSGKEWDGLMYIVTSEDEGNVMTNTQVAVAKAKGWNPHYYDGKEWVPYADIKPVLRGDVNEDGVVNGTDIQEVINIIVNAD